VNTAKVNAVDIEDVLCSKTRLKILKLLLDSESLNVSEIARQAGVNYAKTLEHLNILEAEGILMHTMFGKRIRFYKFNQVSPKAKAIRNLIEAFATS
jgi:predicted transcriptional regulator